MKNIIKEIKTTVLGLSLWIFVGYNFRELNNTLIIGGVLLGLCLFFAKDKLTLGLETLITKTSDKF